MKIRSRPTALACAVALLVLQPAAAMDATWSGFATLGYARSNSAYTYQGSIDNDGTLRRDTLAAGQLDLHLAPQWSATMQAQVAAAGDSNSAWEAKAAWAFLAWRPDNDWLLRAGRVRLPLYLYSEALDIGVSSDMARMPHEMYSITPTNDFTGLYVTRNFALGDRDISADVYRGSANTHLRQWYRDGMAPYVAAGPVFPAVNVRVHGLVLTFRSPDLTWRLGVHNTSTGRRDGAPIPVTYPRVDLAPGLGYWQVDDTMPGPGIATVPRIHNQVVTAGAEWSFGSGWRLAGELVRMSQRDTELGSESRAGYLALFRQVGAFTPYLSYARQHSNDRLLNWRANLTDAVLPPFIPGAAQINAAQRMSGESIYAADQHSLALGTSYATSPHTKLKVEWMRTRVGALSAHFDTPPGKPDARSMNVNTLSVNYSVAF